MLMSLILMHSISCLIECVSVMVKNNYLSPFRSNDYKKSENEYYNSPSGAAGKSPKYRTMAAEDIETVRTTLIKCNTDSISNCEVKNQYSLPNKRTHSDYSTQKKNFYTEPDSQYSTINECKTDDISQKYNRDTHSNSIKKQEIIAVERLLESDGKLEIKLNEMRAEYKKVCMELESKNATKRLEEVNRDITKEPTIYLGQWIIQLPEPLNRLEKENYVNYLLNNIRHDLQDINNVAMGELLDDDVITTVMEACQEKHRDILFVNPCITQCIQFSQSDEISSFLDPIDAKRYDNIFFVINDTSNGSRGTHWSLLLLNKKMQVFSHYDSLKGMNYKIALELSKKLSNYFDIWQILDVECEQQTNNTDCGIYVLDNMLRIILVLQNDVNVDNEHITFLKISKLPPSFTKTRIYMMNTYISSILQKVKRSLRLESINQ